MILAIVLSASVLPVGFQELDEMCARDHDRLWGVSLCGPTLFVDPETRAVVANRPLAETTLPASIGIANTAVDWKGERWTMLRLPLPSDPYARRVLLAHESFHRIQGELGFPGGREGGNAHLDTLDGRYWLQLEWRALSAALTGDDRGLADALAFRAERRRLFPNAAAEERELEMHEGLAEYTGTRLAEPELSKRIPHVVDHLRDAERTPTFVRSFAYASGPAWGAILEMRDGQWTRHLRAPDDLGALAGAAPAGNLEDRAARYDGRSLMAAERAREEKRQATLRQFRHQLVDGPVLVLPLRHMSMNFNPNDAVPFEPNGTVYPTITVHDDWGTIVVTTNGGLISSDWSRITVPANPQAYRLTLNPGWVVVSDRRVGDMRVDKR
jgi:hypothetical protein